MKIKRLIYFIPLLLIGCKEAPKDYYLAGEVKVIEHTTIVSDSDTISVDNTSKNTSFNSNKVSPEAIEYMNKNRCSKLTKKEQLEMLGIHVNNNRIYNSYNSKF